MTKQIKSALSRKWQPINGEIKRIYHYFSGTTVEIREPREIVVLPYGHRVKDVKGNKHDLVWGWFYVERIADESLPLPVDNEELAKQLGDLLFENHTHADLCQPEDVVYTSEDVSNILVALGYPKPDFSNAFPNENEDQSENPQNIL